jgi:hypothetical protein
MGEPRGETRYAPCGASATVKRIARLIVRSDLTAPSFGMFIVAVTGEVFR